MTAIFEDMISAHQKEKENSIGRVCIEQRSTGP